MPDIRIIADDTYISVSFLLENGMEKDLDNWTNRNRIIYRTFDERKFILYSSLTVKGRAKLPSESDLRGMLIQQQYDERQAHYDDAIRYAYERDFTKYRQRVCDYVKQLGKSLPDNRITEAARKMSVFNVVTSCNTYGSTEFLINAVVKYYPNINNQSSYAEAKCRAKKDLMGYVVKGSWFSTKAEKFDNQVKGLVLKYMSVKTKYNSVTITSKVKKDCIKAGIAYPSNTWVKEYMAEQKRTNPHAYEKRYGTELTQRKLLPYAKLIQAENAGSQWQIDGWDMPFYMEGFKKLVVFVVKDVHSRKIVGYSLDKSENTKMILEALQMAVEETGYLPYEIVSDNHSFNQTKEAEYFKKALEDMGVRWKVTSNPQEKAVIERGFRYFEEPLKEREGYIGQGVRTREIDGRPPQEYIDKYTRSGWWRTESDIKRFAIDMIVNFNNTHLKPLKNRTPNEVHEASEKPAIVTIDFYKRLSLFTPKTDIKVSQGLLKITRSGTTYLFGLQPTYANRLNGQTVTVRYEDLKDCVYVFNQKDECICRANRAKEIHAAAYDQTQESTDNFNKHTARLKGMKTQAKKYSDEIIKSVGEAHHEAAHDMNERRMSKDSKIEIFEDVEKRLHAHKMGLDESTFETSKTDESTAFTEPETSNKNKKLFSPKGFIIDETNMFCTD